MFRVEAYVAESERCLDADLLAAVVAGPDGVVSFIGEQTWRKRYLLDVWRHLWAHAYLVTMENEMQVP